MFSGFLLLSQNFDFLNKILFPGALCGMRHAAVNRAVPYASFVTCGKDCGKMRFQILFLKTFSAAKNQILNIQNKIRQNSIMCAFELLENEALKVQIISECSYEIIVSPIRPTKKFPRFLPQPIRRGQIKKIKALYYTN